MSKYIPESLKNQIAASDKGRCCYCLTTEANSGISMTYVTIFNPAQKVKKLPLKIFVWLVALTMNLKLIQPKL